ncbi:CapA family protein [Propionivibrio dicarboxylicus]|uniref:Poly-gamma-glutamate synthesis protein (Capsule biosynthesis protein) n=1 Tax=Propionivibrio dicarboxylicus TaxID=83767 RepID=A0A1G7WHV4_9RHOO|nr:CapA family protein [Propionivibrio dicarboxylicus]SDG71541.1 poly-gamma-glutamate synthesis protein (capsule biosynthesis protein) [Propionivibrio dicarboxylicus]
MIRSVLLALAAFALPATVAAETVANAAPVSIVFVGDIMLADTPGKVIRHGGDPFGPVASLLAAADIRIGNLECTVASSGQREAGKVVTLRAHPRVLKVLGHHFDGVSVANNHSGDFGPTAFAEMIGHLERSGIGFFGGGRTLADAHRPLIVERQGIRIAFLGYNEFMPRRFEADEDKAGIAWSEDAQVRFDIAAARQRHHADVVIPVMHWGWENESVANDRQRALARLMIDAGADAVVGGHPHVVQDTEIYRGKPVFYSLGNFVFDGFDPPENNTGWILRLEVDRHGPHAWRIDPVRIDAKGIPHPSTDPATCWRAGMTDAAPCGDRVPAR